MVDQLHSKIINQKIHLSNKLLSLLAYGVLDELNEIIMVTVRLAVR